MGAGPLQIIQRSATVLIDTQGLIRYLKRTTLPFDALDEAAVVAALEQAQVAEQLEPQAQPIGTGRAALHILPQRGCRTRSEEGTS